MKRDIEQLSFRTYVTDTLQAIAENTAVPAARFTDGKAGKAMTRRWSDWNKPAPPEETRTAEEIIAHIRTKLKEVE